MTVGAALTRVTTIDAIKPKRGASGDLLFVTLRHEISADGVAAIREEQDIVFREAASATPAPTAAPATPRSEERRVGQGVSVRVDLGGRRNIKKKKKTPPPD